MVLSSIISYVFIMLVLYISASIASRRYAISIKRGVTNPPFLTPEVLFFIVFFTVVFAIRYNVGTDFFNYLEMYESRYMLEYSRNEFLYQKLSLFLCSINAHPIFYFGVFVLLQITFFLASFKDERYLFPFLTLFLFTNSEVGTWMNIIRSSVAMCIWLYSVKYIEKKKFLPYLILCLIALGFHKSTIFYIPLFFLFLRKDIDVPSIKKQLFLLLLAFIVLFLFYVIAPHMSAVVGVAQHVLYSDSYDAYSVEAMLEESNREVSGTGIAYLVKLLVDVFIIINSKKMQVFYSSKKFTIYYWMYIVALFTYYCFPASVISFSRPFRFFYIFRTIMLAYFAYYLWRNRKVKNNEFYLLLFVTLYLGLFVFSQVVSGEDSPNLYRTWLSQI